MRDLYSKAKKNSIKVISLFSGCGGLDLGFIWQGFNIVWANDVMPDAVKTYKMNIGEHIFLEDISRVDLKNIPNADVVIGGPPCQSFSLVGRRKVDDERGRLVFNYLDIIRKKQPFVFLLENVPGIDSSKINGAPLMHVLMDEFRKIGYHVNKIKLIATDYLVPQKRKRVILLGCREKLLNMPDPEDFAAECFGINSKNIDLSSRMAIRDLGKPTSRGMSARYVGSPTNVYQKILRHGNRKYVDLHEFPYMSERDKAFVKYIKPGGNYLDIPDKLATKRILNFKRTGGRTTTYGRLHPNKPAWTINTHFNRPNVGCNYHYGQRRLITAREALRFQSFPDWFNVYCTSQRSKNTQIGNAVPPLMARAIAWEIQKAFD